MNEPKPPEIPIELYSAYSAVRYLRLEASLYGGYTTGGIPAFLPDGMPFCITNMVSQQTGNIREYTMDETHKFGQDFKNGILGLCDDIGDLMLEAQINFPKTQGKFVNLTYLRRNFGSRLAIWRDQMQSGLNKFWRDGYPDDGFTLRDTVRAHATDDAFLYVDKLFPEAREFFEFKPQ